MKRILIIGLLLFFISFSFVKAETFVEGNYLSGEYISKRKDGSIHYLTVQYLKDSKGNIVYCLEPYTKFVEGKSYTSYEGNIDGYSDLSASQKRKISLIVYYGYGYGSRNTSKWYAITQYLIWDTVTDGNGTIYFTDKLNGNKIEKYTSEINELLKDVNSHDIKPDSIYDRTVNMNESFSVLGIDKDSYEIVSSSYEYNLSSNLLVKNVSKNGYIELRKLSNYYQNRVAIFDSTQSQDLIRPGNVINSVYKIKVNVSKGNIVLDIKKDDSVYTVESDFSGTCYDVLKDGIVIDSVCTNKEMSYKTGDLPFGNYEIKQKSVGLGYRKDEKVYKVSISSNDSKPVVNLYNLLIRNEIEIKKYACKEQICDPESAAKFSVYDIKNNLVNNIVTDKDGHTKIELGYGTYKLKQISGLYGYSISDEFNEKIIDEESKHFKELFNYYIEAEEEKNVDDIINEPTKEEIIEKEIVNEPQIKKQVLETKVEKKEEIKEEDEIIEEVPDTGINDSFISKLFYYFAEIIIGIVKRIENIF